jgi:D-alanyl-lipoteichoic acid acyltransferase DltB (MBOAT superfamily)
MLFNSPEFVLAFLPAALFLCFLAGRIGGPRWTLRVIVAVSLCFYGWWNPKFALLLAGSILVNYALGRQILGTRGRFWLVTGITANLALLGWFKYANFMIHDVLRLHAPELDIFLPLAISFFTFQQIMYLVECHRRECIDAGLLPYAAFVAFFPHLIAGPIVRPREIMPQLLAHDLAVPRAHHIADGLTIFLLGSPRRWCWRTRSRTSPMSASPPQPEARRSALSRLGTPRHPTHCRSTSISPAIPTWRSAWRAC